MTELTFKVTLRELQFLAVGTLVGIGAWPHLGEQLRTLLIAAASLMLFLSTIARMLSSTTR